MLEFRSKGNEFVGFDSVEYLLHQSSICRYL